MNRRGMIGTLPVSIFVTFGVIVLLIVFILFSSIVKEFDESNAGIKLYREAELGIKNVVNYINEDYKKISQIRRLSEGGNKNVLEILKEVKYEG